MPIDMAPPQINLPQITPAQYTDPLQTLAQIGNLRTQRMQQQEAGLGLQKQQMDMQSMQRLMQAYHDAGGDPDKTAQLAPQYGVMPDHVIAMQAKLAEMANKRADTKLKGTQADKDALIARDLEHDQLNQAYGPVWDEQDPAKAQALGAQTNQNLIQQGWAPEKLWQDFTPNGIKQAQALYTTQNYIKTKAEALEKAATAAKTQQEAAQGERNQVISEITAATDPATGIVSNPADLAAIQQRHPKVQLPLNTKAGISQFTRSGVTPEKLPEFDLNTMKANIGLLGNSEFDQYQLRYAQSIGKKPNELNFGDMQKVLQLYAKDKQDPTLYGILLGLKGSQESLAKAQISAMPTEAELESEARDYRNLDMPPSRLAAMREGRVQYFPQILEKARAQAAAEGQPFSPATLEAKYDTWLDTEKKFASGGQEAALLRGFENLMRHTGLLWKAKDALAQNDYPVMKQIANAMGVAVGKDAPTTYDTIAGFVADETAKAFLPGGGGESERAAKLANFSRGLGTQQLTSNIKATMDLADSQRQTLEREYAEGTFGKGPRIGRLFSPDALANRDMVLGRKPAPARAPGGTPGKIIVKAGDGSTHPFDTEAQARAFEAAVKAAGGTTSR